MPAWLPVAAGGVAHTCFRYANKRWRTHARLACQTQTNALSGLSALPKEDPRARLRGLAARRAAADNHAAENSGRTPGKRVVARSACRVASRAPGGGGVSILGHRRGGGREGRKQLAGGEGCLQCRGADRRKKG